MEDNWIYVGIFKLSPNTLTLSRHSPIPIIFFTFFIYGVKSLKSCPLSNPPKIIVISLSNEDKAI